MEVRVHRTGEDAPTEAAGAAQAAVTEVVDPRGRRLSLRRPGPLAEFRLVRMLEPEVARNGAYVDMLHDLLFVAAIDGAPVAPPQSERELEAFIVRLGNDGVAAVREGVDRVFDADAREDREAAKN
jgi:hypothetical protein